MISPALRPTLLAAVLFALASSAGGEVVVSEISYAPPGDAHRLEFIELYNSGEQPEDIGGWRLLKAVDFVFPKGTILQPKSYAIVAASKDEFSQHYPAEFQLFGDYSGKLNNSGELIILSNERGLVKDRVDYDVAGDWPPVEDVTGLTLELINPKLDNGIGASWEMSVVEGGTPGRRNSIYSAVSEQQVAASESMAEAVRAASSLGAEDDERRAATRSVASGMEEFSGGTPTPVAIQALPEDFAVHPYGIDIRRTPPTGPRAMLFHMEGVLPCRTQLENLAGASLPSLHPGVEFVLVDVRLDRRAAKEHKVIKVPTWILLGADGTQLTMAQHPMTLAEIDSWLLENLK